MVAIPSSGLDATTQPFRGSSVRSGGPTCRPSGDYEEYHPFGTTAWWAEDSALTARRKRYRFTGKERDEWTGLAYHGARYYMPWLGRWESCDPIGMGDGVNRYAYCRGNPISGRDPTGMAGNPSSEEFVGPPAPNPRTVGGIEVRDNLLDTREQTIAATRTTATRPGGGATPTIPTNSSVPAGSLPNETSAGFIGFRQGGGAAAGTGFQVNVPGLGSAVVLDAFFGRAERGTTEALFVILSGEQGTAGPSSSKAEVGGLRVDTPSHDTAFATGKTQIGWWTNRTGGGTRGVKVELDTFEYENTMPLGDKVAVGFAGAEGGVTVSNTGLQVGAGATGAGVKFTGAAQRFPAWVGAWFPERAQNEVLATLGFAGGAGISGRLHWADSDQDTVREYGFGLDFEFVSVDVAAELGVPAMQIAPNNMPGGWNPGIPRRP